MTALSFFPEREAYQLHLITTEGVQVTGHPDGMCLRFGGEVVEIIATNSWCGARKAKLLADEALVMLSDCLGRM